jgi:transposase
MKVAIVPVSMMGEQLRLWHLEREVNDAGRRLENCIKGVTAARTSLKNKQAQLLDSQTRIDAARGSIDKILGRDHAR